jgi:hypothetical protein
LLVIEYILVEEVIDWHVTVEKNLRPLVRSRISLLAAGIEDPEVKPQTLHIKPKLIVRESCGSQGEITIKGAT